LDEVKDPHKLKYKNVFGLWRGSEAPSNIGDLKQLQTLRGIQADKHLISQLECLTQLRSLAITNVDSSNNFGLCNCISKISHLPWLSVKASPGNALELSEISPPPRHLRKLILRGSLASIPEWFTLINCLTHLYLFDSKLGADKNLIHYLHQLHNLIVLALDDAFRVPHLLFNAGDLSALRTLSITNTAELRSMEITRACKSLRCILGLEHLTELNELKLKKLDVLDNSRIPKTLPCENTF